MKRISVIFGTRPEAIKLAPVILTLQRAAGIDCRVCVTGQHRQMLDQVLAVFDIKPDVDLNLMQPNQTLAGLTSCALTAIDRYLATDKPELVLVQGDTTTVLTAALAAFYRRIPLGHVEAGLRTGNMNAPWPEEANRVLTTRLATWHFAPTDKNRQNLLKEGVPEKQILITGNTVIDALHLALAKVKDASPPISGVPGASLDFLADRHMVLITGHRRENFGEGFENICHALVALANRFPDVHFIYPVHLNPHVREPVERILRLRPIANIHLIEPQAYLPFVALMNRAYLILTDSGGVQEEAPSLGKPVLVMRETTERPEAVEAGTVTLIGTERDMIYRETSRLLLDADEYKKMAYAHNPYGDGNAARRIVEKVCEL